MRGDRGQDKGIDIVLAAGLNEYLSEAVRYFRVELVWINRAKVPHIFLRGPAADLYSKGERQYGPKSHVPLFCRIRTFGKLLFFQEGGRAFRRVGV